MEIRKLFTRRLRMKVSKELGRNVSQKEINLALRIILIGFFLILALIVVLVYLLF